MLYAMLAYHVEGVITAMTPNEDDALMEGLHRVHGRLTERSTRARRDAGGHSVR